MPERVRKPEWLKISIGANERYTETNALSNRIAYIPSVAAAVAPIWGNVGGKAPQPS